MLVEIPFIAILLLLLMAPFLVVKEIFGVSVVVLMVQLLHNCLTFAPTLAHKKIGLLVNALSLLTSHLSMLLPMK